MAISACILSGLLVACGGGGDTGATAAAAASLATPALPVGAAAPTFGTAAQGVVDTAQLNLAANEKHVLAALATPLTLDDLATVPPVTPTVPVVSIDTPTDQAPVAVTAPAPVDTTVNQTGTQAKAPLLDWVVSPQTFAAWPPKTVSDLFRTEDLRVSVSASHLYPTSAIGLQCQGTIDRLVKVPAVRMAAGKTTADTTERFGQAGIVGGDQALRFAVDLRDELPPDRPPRCEMLASPTADSALPVGEPFWFAVSLWLDDLGGTQDEQIVSQWHQNDPRLNLNPFMALIQKGNTLRVELRHSADALATKASTSVIVPATLTVKPRQWVQIVVKAQIAQQADAVHYFQLWQDGTQVINYTGPLGYSLASGAYAYAKVGLYKWLNGNTWDATVPTRQIMLRSMLIARDPLGRYSVDKVGSALVAQ